MTVTPARRHALFEQVRSLWGPDAAETLMELLPPESDQIVTKADLAATRAELNAEISAVRLDLAALRTEMRKAFADQAHRLYAVLVTSILTSVGLSFAAVHFA